MGKSKYTLATLTAVLCACLMNPVSASASSIAYNMCNTDQAGGSLCASYSYAGSGSRVTMVSPADVVGGPYWFYPNGTTAGQIRLSGTNDCLRQDNAAGNPNVILYPCQGMVSEEWIPRQLGEANWSFQNQDTKGCLNDDYYTHYINVASCNDGPDEVFLLYIVIEPT